MIDYNDRPVNGILKVEQKLRGSDEWNEIFTQSNLVVNNAKFILRDLMFGEVDKIISKMIFGDMNLTPQDDIVNVPHADPDSTALVNKLYEKPITKSKSNYSTSPSINYVAILEEGELNGTGTQIITEFGLMNEGDSMFSIKHRAAIIKDNNISLKFTWSLVFS